MRVKEEENDLSDPMRAATERVRTFAETAAYPIRQLTPD